MASDGIASTVGWCVWAGVAASATAWGLGLWSIQPDHTGVPVVSMAVEPRTPNTQTIAQWLSGSELHHPGQDAVAAQPMASRLVLWGVAKAGMSEAMALIAVDGQAAQTYRLGQTVLPGWLLQSVTADQAVLGPSADKLEALVLTMPKQPHANQPADPLALPQALNPQP